jgi:hypothetical protein
MRRMHEDERVAKRDIIILESLVEKYGAKGVEAAINRLNEDFSLMKNKMTYEEIAKAFSELGLREPMAEITSDQYPEVKELINYLPDEIYTQTWGLEKVAKRHGIKFVIGYNGKIYLNYVRIENKYNKEYWCKIDIRTLPEKYAQNCLICLIKILHRLKKENEESSAKLINDNDNIKQLNSNANKTIVKEHYNYDGEFYIKSCSFEEFTNRYPLTKIARNASNNHRDYFDYELGGDFNDTQHKKSGRQQPRLVLYGRFYIEDKRFELIYDNPWEGVYSVKKVDYIPFEAFVRKPR